MPRIGIHTSIAGSLPAAVQKAVSLGCETFQIFSSSPRMWRRPALDPAETREFRSELDRHDLRPLAIHCNYLINLASADRVTRARSVEAFRGEMERALALDADFLVLHPGSYRNQTMDAAMRVFALSLAEAVRGLRSARPALLLENTAGGGATMGRLPAELLELRRLAGQCTDLEIRFCIDTAHCFAGGLDFFEVLGAFPPGDICVIHANDCRSAFGSRLDRHEHIGKGGIGREGFRRIVGDPRLRHKPFILETPIDRPGDDRRNVRALKSLAKTR